MGFPLVESLCNLCDWQPESEGVKEVVANRSEVRSRSSLTHTFSPFADFPDLLIKIELIEALT